MDGQGGGNHNLKVTNLSIRRFFFFLSGNFSKFFSEPLMSIVVYDFSLL